jgi:hypothetical protein
MGRIFSWEYFSFLQLDNAVAYKVRKYIDRESRVVIPDILSLILPLPEF